MDFTIKGTASAKDLNITNSLGEPVATAGFVSTRINRLHFNSSTYLLDYVHASNVDLNFILRNNGNNFTAVMKPASQATSTASSSAAQPMTLKINDLYINSSKITFTDKTLVKTCILPMRNVEFQSKNFDLNGTNEYKIKASFPEGGNAKLDWKGNINNLTTQQIMVNIQNMSLKLFSPYCLQYMAYDLTDGNFNFISRNSIINNNINSTNLLDAYKASVGKKHKELQPEYNVPLKLALYVLKDKDDKISLDLPVKGNLKDPKFSYSKIIFRTIVNLMVKIAVSPFRFLAGALGMNSDKLEAVAIEPLQTDFTAEQYHQFNDIASIIKKKPEMMLTLTQFVDMKEELPAYAIYHAKEAYLLNQHKNEAQKTISSSDIQQIKNNDPQFEQYINALVQAKDASKANASMQEKINILYPSDSLRTGLIRLLENRNTVLRNYMISSYEVPAKNLTTKSADQAILDTYSEKAKYKVEMHLPGEENTTPTNETTKK